MTSSAIVEETILIELYEDVVEAIMALSFADNFSILMARDRLVTAKFNLSEFTRYTLR